MRLHARVRAQIGFTVFALLMAASVTAVAAHEGWVGSDDIAIQAASAAIFILACSVAFAVGRCAARGVRDVRRAGHGATVVGLRVISDVMRNGRREATLAAPDGARLRWVVAPAGPMCLAARTVAGLQPLAGGAPVPLGDDGHPFRLTPGVRRAIESQAGASRIDADNTPPPVLPARFRPRTHACWLQRLRLLVVVILAAAVVAAVFLPEDEAISWKLAAALVGLLALVAAPGALRLRALFSDLRVTDSHVALASALGELRVPWESVAEVVVAPANAARFGTGEWRIDVPLRRVAEALATPVEIPPPPDDALAAALWRAAERAHGADPEITLYTADGRVLLRLPATHGWDAAHAIGARAAELGCVVQVVGRE